MDQIFIFLSRFENIKLIYFHKQGDKIKEALKLREQIIEVANNGLEQVQHSMQANPDKLLEKINNLINKLIDIVDSSLKQQIQYSIEPLNAETFINVLKNSQVAQQILEQTQPLQSHHFEIQRSKSSLKRTHQKQQSNDQISTSKVSRSQLGIQKINDDMTTRYQIKGVQDNKIPDAPNIALASTDNTRNKQFQSSQYNVTIKQQQDEINNQQTNKSQNEDINRNYTQINNKILTSSKQKQEKSIHQQENINIYNNQQNNQLLTQQLNYQRQTQMAPQQQLQLMTLVNQQNEMLSKQNKSIVKLLKQNQSLLYQLSYYKQLYLQHTNQQQLIFKQNQ